MVVIGATNKPDNLEPAVLDRFGERIYVPPPTTVEEFERIVEAHVKKRAQSAGPQRALTPSEVRSVAEAVVGRNCGFSGRDVARAIDEAYRAVEFIEGDVFEQVRCEMDEREPVPYDAALFEAMRERFETRRRRAR